MTGMKETKDLCENAINTQLETARAFKDNYTTTIAGYEFIMFPDVFNPEVFLLPTHIVDIWLHLIRTMKPEALLEIGSGAGYFAILAALNGANRVTATDITQQAVANIQANIIKYNLTDRMKALCGSVFEPLDENDLFDVIFWDFPFNSYIGKSAEELDAHERTICDPDYRCVETFLSEAHKHLTAAGHLLVVFSKKLGDSDRLLKLINKHGWYLELIENSDHKAASVQKSHKDNVDINFYELIKQ